MPECIDLYAASSSINCIPQTTENLEGSMKKTCLVMVSIYLLGGCAVDKAGIPAQPLSQEVHIKQGEPEQLGKKQLSLPEMAAQAAQAAADEARKNIDAQARATPETTTSVISGFLARTTLTMFKLQVWKQVQEGKLSPTLLTCAQSLDASSITTEFDKMLTDKFDQNDLATATKFFASDVGKKMERSGKVKIYLDAGAVMPELFPTYTEAEYKEIDDFKKTSVGKKLMIEKILDSEGAQKTVRARIFDLTKSCIANRK